MTLESLSGHTVLMEKDAKDGPPQACIRLKQLRKALGLKQREMGQLLGDVPQGRYKQYEIRTRPTREIVAAVEKQFGLPPAAFLSDESIQDSDFNQMLVELRDGTVRKVTKLIHSSQLGRHTDIRGDVASRETEGQVGQGSIDFILTTLAEIKADIAKNRQAIADLEEARNKPGFRKGRR
jgi:transcriptional regulator with XRE-family HTH domain